MKNSIVLLGCLFIVPLYAHTQEHLISHVQESIEQAEQLQSKLTNDQLALEGMSSSKVRHFLNNICSLPQAHYLEIGVWKGSTFVSALYHNNHVGSAIAVENWSAFGAPRTTLFNNVTQYLEVDKIDIIETDAFVIDKQVAIKEPIDIYFYDASTDVTSVKKAFTYFNDSFAENFIAIVDDYNQETVRQGVQAAFDELQYDVLFEQELPAYFNGDTAHWWNGVYVAVVQKKGTGKRPVVTEESKKLAAKRALQQLYTQHCQQYSDIHEHLPTLCTLAARCASVTEVGVRSMVSTWAFLQGLTESSAPQPYYLGIDLLLPPDETFAKAERLATDNGVSFNFIAMNDMEIPHETIPAVDLLFIDSLHTYCHLTYELEKFAPKANKFIALHDTSAPWGNAEDTEYQGDYSEYPAAYDRNKKGLWPAVQDFLGRHPEWELEIRYFNNHGLTVLKRVGAVA